MREQNYLEKKKRSNKTKMKSNMKLTVNLPQSQKEHIVKALQVYKTVSTLGILGIPYDQEYKDFDCTCLIAMFKDTDIDIKVELTKELHDNFAGKHGVDFPIYSN